MLRSQLLKGTVPFLVLSVLGQATAGAIAGAPSVPTAPKSGPVTYVVKPGDNLETIAKRYGTTVKALAAANKPPNEARKLTFRPDQKPGDRQSPETQNAGRSASTTTSRQGTR